MVDLWLEQNKLSHNCLSRDTFPCLVCVGLLCVLSSSLTLTVL
jgi:hypothetical protein